MAETAAASTFQPYRHRWRLADVRRFFAQPAGPRSVTVRSERVADDLLWRELTFSTGSEFGALATLVLPTATAVMRGIVLAHGGSDDGRWFFVAEAAELAARGAAVILPVTRIRQNDGVDPFATDVREAVLVERAALDVLIEIGAPPRELSFLGHSAGGAYGAVLSAVEPRLSRIAIFANGAGPLARSALAAGLSRGGQVTKDVDDVARWFDLAHFVGVHRSAQLLVQHGRFDTTVPMAAARALLDAAVEPKIWAGYDYDYDHGLDADPLARQDRAVFVQNTRSASAKRGNSDRHD